MRLNSVFAKFSCAFVVAMLNACGDDSSSGVEADEHGDKPYCEVRSTKSSVVQEIFIPNIIWGESSVTIKGDGITLKMTEKFYEGYSLDRDSVCEELSEKYSTGVRSFNCDKDGASVTIRASLTEKAPLQEVIDEWQRECYEHDYSWLAINSSGEQANSSSSSKGSSSSSKGYSSSIGSSSSSSSSNSSSSDGSSLSGSSSSLGTTVPKTKILRGDIYNAFIDKRDGKAYRVMQVGDYVWMLDNLYYAGGTGDETLGGNVYCRASAAKGYLYDFAAAMNNPACRNSWCNYDDVVVQGACPDGWALPPARAWEKLKTDLKDVSSFFANPLGEWSDSWRNDGIARFWSSTEDSRSGGKEYYFSLRQIQSQGYDKSMGYAIRCIAMKDVVLDTLVEEPKSSSSSMTAYSSSYGLAESSSSYETPVSSSFYSVDEDYFKRSEAWAAQDTFIDARDGQSYHVTEVDGMIWMAENLRYRDSTATPVLQGKTWCIGVNEEYCEYGVLYTFDAAMADAECASGKTCGDKGDEYRGICPEGWHMPVGGEWTTLSQWLLSGSQKLFGSVATGEHGNGSNALDHFARFWSASEGRNNKSAVEWYVSPDGTVLTSQEYDKNFGYAVRCVKNAEKPVNN